jgi:hypothetical protein
MNNGKDNRYVVDVPGTQIHDDNESPDRINTGLIGLPRRDSLMEDTMNLKD